MNCNTQVFLVLHYLPEFAQINFHWVHDAIQPSHPLLSPSPPTFNLSQYQGISHESALHISFSISPSKEYSGLISFRIDWFYLFAAQGTLKSLIQHHNSKTSILWPSAFFTVQLSHPYMTTGKTIALIIWTFVSKVISLLFNTLSRFVIVFLPRRKCLLISWLQSPSTIILEPKEITLYVSSLIPPIFPSPAVIQWAMLIASDLLCSLLGFVFFEMPLYVFLLGHANGIDYVDASVPESSGLCHPALPPWPYLEHFLHVNRSSELSPCARHCCMHFTCMTLTEPAILRVDFLSSSILPIRKLRIRKDIRL